MPAVFSFPKQNSANTTKPKFLKKFLKFGFVFSCQSSIGRLQQTGTFLRSFSRRCFPVKKQKTCLRGKQDIL
jgi:hypothetical protein